MSEWIYEDIVSPKILTKNCQDFCPTYRLQDKNPDNFPFIFWEKQWLHKFILKFTDLNCTNLIWRIKPKTFLSSRQGRHSERQRAQKGSKTLWSCILKYSLTGNFTTRVQNWKLFSRLHGWINVAYRETGFFFDKPSWLSRHSTLPNKHIGTAIFFIKMFCLGRYAHFHH